MARLGLCTLELRRLHFDLVFCYKIVFGLVHVNCDDFFTFATVANTRGHDYKLYKPYRSSNLRKKFQFFTDRVINVWNSLPSTVNFTSLMAFRCSLNNVDFGSHIHCRLE